MVLSNSSIWVIVMIAVLTALAPMPLQPRLSKVSDRIDLREIARHHEHSSAHLTAAIEEHHVASFE